MLNLNQYKSNDEELLLKQKNRVDYIVNQFNRDFKGNPDNLILESEALPNRKGYRLYLNSNKVYYDVSFLAKRLKKEDNLKLFLGNVSVGYLGDLASNEENYFLFVRIIRKLLKLQKKNFSIYQYAFPEMVKRLTNFLSKYTKQGYLQDSLDLV